MCAYLETQDSYQNEPTGSQPDQKESEIWLEAGIDAARSGDAVRARGLLLRVVQVDEHCLPAWYWLGRVVQDPDEREICLENVLALDPAHTAVQAELADLRRHRTEAETALALSSESTIPRTEAEYLASAAATGALPCPYCGSATDAVERTCPVCDGKLWTRERKSKGHSVASLALVVVWLALANFVWLGMVLTYLFVGLCAGLAESVGAQATLETVARLLGFEPLTLPQAAQPLAPGLLLGAGVFCFSLFVAWGLYQRLRLFYWFTVALLVLSPLLMVYRMTTGATTWLGVATFGLLFFLAILLAFAAYDQYAWRDKRLSATLDHDVDSASSLYARGQTYAKENMWARAAVHWSKAVAQDPGHPDYRLALALAYINLEQPDRAREHLVKVQEVEPSHPGLRKLLALTGVDPS